MCDEIKKWELSWQCEDGYFWCESFTCTESEIKEIAKDKDTGDVVDVKYEEDI